MESIHTYRSVASKGNQARKPQLELPDLPRSRQMPTEPKSGGLSSWFGSMQRPVAGVLAGAASLPAVVGVAVAETPVAAHDHATTDLAHTILFGPVASESKAITGGPYADLLNGLSHPELSTVKKALADGELFLLRDAPLPGGVRVLDVVHDSGEGQVATKIRVEDGKVTNVSAEKTVQVWAYESDPSSPAGLQPISIKHFDLDASGQPTELSGPRVRVRLPTEIATKVDEFLLTKVVESVPSGLTAKVSPSADGKFEYAPDSLEAGATTAFYGVTRTIDAADRWAGGEIRWGDKTQLEVKAYDMVTDFFNAFYNKRTGELVLGAMGEYDAATKTLKPYSGVPAGFVSEVKGHALDGAKSRDIVSHEAGHAVLHALKPGMSKGMGMAYHEGFADVIAMLTAFDDPEVIARVLAETGGDLRKPNEATRMAEVIGHAKHAHGNETAEDDHDHFLRFAGKDVKLGYGLNRDSVRLPGMGFTPTHDPHHVGQVFSRAMYDSFMSIYEGEVAKGVSAEEAIATARETTGTLMLRATRYTPEHQTSMRDAALAILRVDLELYGGANQSALKKAFADRGLVDKNEDIQKLVDARKAKLPNFVMPKTVTNASEILAKIAEYESIALQGADEKEASDNVGLIWHNPYLPSVTITDFEKLSVYSDTTTDDGVRVIRLAYEGKEQWGTETRKVTQFISTVWDADGKIVDVHHDRPIEEGHA